MAEDVIHHLKSIFARFGIHNELASDNGPQHSSHLLKEFARNYNFTHTTSSPRYPQSNGEAERAVRTIKDVLKKSSDPYIGLLLYRTTPLSNWYSPSELLMGRKLRANLPMVTSQLFPDQPAFSQKEHYYKEQMQENFDSRHHSKEHHH